MKQLGFNRRHCSACDPQKGYLHGTTSLTQAANGCSRRNGRRRHVIARGTVNSDEQHPVLTAPLRDAHRTLSWPQKSSLFLFRTDGMSCSRELVTGTGTFRFSHPSTQQHLLVWRDRPKVVMVIKKLGNELLPEFLEVVEYLLEAEQMHVVVEPAMYEEAAAAGLCMERLFTFTPEECGRLADHIDFVVCLGGDGVILHASSLFRQHIPPVVSFHLGSMGFLTNHPYPDFKQELRQVIYGCQKLATCSIDSQDMGPSGNSLGVMITLRMRLHCAIVRAGQTQPEQVRAVGTLSSSESIRSTGGNCDRQLWGTLRCVAAAKSAT
eukprot:GHRQ01009145.1.p1 GENE.GHRQ01009145.1~~GHRQ01009145.1.p1  ORF type:complete len:323 (+),score=97.29 GHRQ01009145.1:158-1126(+)